MLRGKHRALKSFKYAISLVSIILIVSPTVAFASTSTPSATWLMNNSMQLNVSTMTGVSSKSTSDPKKIAGTASGAVLSAVSSATCGGVTYISGQNGVTVSQGFGTSSVSVSNRTLFAKKYPATANRIIHGGIITSPSGSFYNVNPTKNNVCEFTSPSSVVTKYKQHQKPLKSRMTYTITLLAGYNSHNKPVTRSNSIVGGSLTNNSANTSKQYCSDGLNNVIVYNNTLTGISLVKKTNSEWILTNNMTATGNQSINLTFTCAGVYQINQFLNGSKFYSSQRKTVTANTITNQTPTIPTPSPTPTPTPSSSSISSGAQLPGHVIIIH